MISIAQSTGDISADIYRQRSAKPTGIEAPQLAGLEKHHKKLLGDAQAAQNPFSNGASTSAKTLPDGEHSHLCWCMPHDHVCLSCTAVSVHLMLVYITTPIVKTRN